MKAIRWSHSPPGPPPLAPAAVGPLRLLGPGTSDDLGGVLAEAISVGLIWSAWRRPEVLALASAAAHRRARIYLIGPADLGRDLSERGWLRDHAGRLLSRRGVDSAADVLLLNSGEDRCAVLFLHGPDRSFWVWLSERQGEAAADWFSHLFWHQAPEEGRAHGGGYRFQRCAAPPFSVPPLSAQAPLWMTRDLLRSAAAPGALVHDPATAPARGLPAFAVSEREGYLEARAPRAGGWSLRLHLERAQARELHAAAAAALRR